jgi:hypothetical protein
MDEKHQETQKDKQCDNCDEGSAVPHGKDEDYQKPEQAKHTSNCGERITDTFVLDGHQHGGDNETGEEEIPEELEEFPHAHLLSAGRFWSGRTKILA